MSEPVGRTATRPATRPRECAQVVAERPRCGLHDGQRPHGRGCGGIQVGTTLLQSCSMDRTYSCGFRPAASPPESLVNPPSPPSTDGSNSTCSLVHHSDWLPGYAAGRATRARPPAGRIPHRCNTFRRHRLGDHLVVPGTLHHTGTGGLAVGAERGLCEPYWEPALDPDGTRPGPARGTGARRNRRHPCTPGQSTEINSPSAGLFRRRRHPANIEANQGLAPVVLEL